jgi:hypothetical protein
MMMNAKGRRAWVGVRVMWSLLATIVPAHVGRSQSAQSDNRLNALVAVLRYRRFWLADSSVFDSCRVGATLGSSFKQIDINDRRLRSMIVVPMSGCGDSGVTKATPLPDVAPINLRAITVSDSSASVELTVRHGEHVHDERYQLRRPPVWFVTRVEHTGMSQFRPSPQQQAPRE